MYTGCGDAAGNVLEERLEESHIEHAPSKVQGMGNDMSTADVASSFPKSTAWTGMQEGSAEAATQNP